MNVSYEAKAKLKIKLKSLADESRIIKREERKALTHGRWGRSHEEPNIMNEGYRTYQSLYRHRKDGVGSESRATLIAYAFIRNRPFPEPTKPEYWRYIAIARAMNIANRYVPERKPEFEGWAKLD